MSVVHSATMKLLPRPLLPCSVIKSRRRYMPFMGQDGSSGGGAGPVVAITAVSAVDDCEESVNVNGEERAMSLPSGKVQ